MSRASRFYGALIAGAVLWVVLRGLLAAYAYHCVAELDPDQPCAGWMSPARWIVVGLIAVALLGLVWVALRNAGAALSASLPVLTMVAALLVIWTLAVVPMNVQETLTAAERAGAQVDPPTAVERRDMGNWALVLRNPALLGQSWALDRPRLPGVTQVATELYASTIDEEFNGRRGLIRTGSLSNRSLMYHALVTLNATFVGFLIGAVLGVALAVGIVHSRVMDMSVMPWAIVSQTIPIVALAPMIIVVLYSIGVQGLLPKAVISAYLSFFPVVVGMVKGLRSPDAMQLDLMHTYNAGKARILWSLRLPASVPYLFASFKIAIAASLVGAIVGELPVQKGGLGARMLAGSYYGQTAQIWSALLLAAALAAALIWVIGWAERRVLSRMGGTV